MPELLGGSKLTPLTDLEPLKIGTNEKGFKEVCNMDNRAVGLPSMNLYGGRLHPVDGRLEAPGRGSLVCLQRLH